jgi:hypothetical protein
LRNSSASRRGIGTGWGAVSDLSKSLVEIPLNFYLAFRT